MRRLLAKALLFAMVTLAVSCSVQCIKAVPPTKDEPTRIIFLVSHGWHAGIVLKRLDIQHIDWPKLKTFTHADYLEIGWGDKDYYTSHDPGPFLAAKALLLPTSSVLHLVGFSVPPEHYFPYSEIIRIELTVPGFERLVNHISQSFLRDESGSAVSLGQGMYGYSRFYASKETYIACKTCNTWTAAVLQLAGCPVAPAVTVNGLMSQARRFGEVIQQRSDPQ